MEIKLKRKYLIGKMYQGGHRYKPRNGNSHGGKKGVGSGHHRIGKPPRRPQL